jgi:hypothetical protein
VSARIYSERFLAARGATLSASYLVPVGRRAVIRSVTAGNLSTASANCALYVGEHVSWFWLTNTGFASKESDVRIVAYQGEFMQVTIEATNAFVQVSGYLFDIEPDVAGRQLAVPAQPPVLDAIGLPDPPEAPTIVRLDL